MLCFEHMVKTIAQAGTGKVPTDARILDAAFATLRDRGYAGASARAIAKVGGFNQALIFYHFGSVDDALLAALDRSAEARLTRYKERLEPIGDLREMVEASYALFKEDAETGHVKVLAEMVTAGASKPELGREVAKRVEPSLEFMSTAFERLTAGSPMAAFMNARDVAYALAALYLGLELMGLLEGERDRAESLFGLLANAASLLGVLMTPAAPDSDGSVSRETSDT